MSYFKPVIDKKCPICGLLTLETRDSADAVIWSETISNTVANNKNTAFMNSSGELIYHIDDLTFFNENLLQEAWDLYQDGKYMTGRTVRCITYDIYKYVN